MAPGVDGTPAARTLGELAKYVGGQILSADPAAAELPITGVADLRMAGPQQIGFLRNPSFQGLAAQTGAGAVLVPQRLELGDGDRPIQVQVDLVDAAFARIAQLFHPLPRAVATEIHPSAVVHPTARLADPVVIGPHVFVGPGVSIGAGAVVMASSAILAEASIGRDCVLYPRVTVYQRCILGRGVVLHSGVVIGADGFGYAPGEDGYVRIPQGGVVELEDEVEIGANTAVDRGTLGVTRIGRGTKIDNLCHIGHNCVIGERNVVAAATLFSGSTRVGSDCQIGGHVLFNGHISICDRVRIGGNSVVDQDITEPGNYMGYPLVPQRSWWRWLLRQRKQLVGGDG